MQPKGPIIAIAWMMGALVSFLVMAVSVRELGAKMHAFQMLFVRSAIGVAILTAVLSVRGWAQVRTRHLGVHLGRNLVYFAGQGLWIAGIALLPLATVAAIEFTVPIWGIFLTVLFLGERMNRGRTDFRRQLRQPAPGKTAIELGKVHPPTRFCSTAKGLRPSQVCIRRARPRLPVNTRLPASTSFVTFDRPIQIAVMVLRSVVT